jgi:penicillin-binding protein 1A
LVIYTTIDSRLQHYAEQAVETHLSQLQETFIEHWKGVKNAPFSEDMESSDIQRLMNRAIKRSERYRKMKRADVKERDIVKVFDTPVEMSVFSWKGDKDTILSPLDSLRHYKALLQTGFMSMDPQTGFVKAWVGGINHKHLKYDHVKDGGRQVGSTFKPFVYATAIDQKKYSPCFEMPNVQVTFEKEVWGLPEDWTPKNSGDKYGGMLTLKSALANSVNTVTARLMKQVGPKPVVRLAGQMGLDISDIPAVPSICLGTPDVSVFEMVGAYSTFANQGIYTEPEMVTRITDKNGIVLYQYQPKTREVMSNEVAYTMLNLMQGVTAPGGSGVRLRFRYNFKNQIAAKTGTTQNQSDGWFIGIVPNLVSGAWVGCEDRSIHFRTITLGQGANMALPIWAEYMKLAYADPTLNISKKDFSPPRQGMSIELDCDKKDIGSIESGTEDNSGFGDEVEF